MKKRTRSFSYKLLVNNGISTLVYCLLHALNSIYLLLLPLGVLIDIQRINSNWARSQLNYVFHLKRMPGFLLFTDVINALLLFLLLVNMVALFKVGYRTTLKK